MERPTRRRKDFESAKRSSPPRPLHPLRDPLDRYKQPLLTGRRGRAIIEFDSFDVIRIRAQFGLTRRRFAQMIGVSYQTLLNWETGRRRPHGPGRALLRALAADPAIVARALLRERDRPVPDDLLPWPMG